MPQTELEVALNERADRPEGAVLGVVGQQVVLESDQLEERVHVYFLLLFVQRVVALHSFEHRVDLVAFALPLVQFGQCEFKAVFLNCVRDVAFEFGSCFSDTFFDPGHQMLPFFVWPHSLEIYLLFCRSGVSRRHNHVLISVSDVELVELDVVYAPTALLAHICEEIDKCLRASFNFSCTKASDRAKSLFQAVFRFCHRTESVTLLQHVHERFANQD